MYICFLLPSVSSLLRQLHETKLIIITTCIIHVASTSSPALQLKTVPRTVSYCIQSQLPALNPVINARLLPHIHSVSWQDLFIETNKRALWIQVSASILFHPFTFCSQQYKNMKSYILNFGLGLLTVKNSGFTWLIFHTFIYRENRTTSLADKMKQIQK